MEEVLCIKSEKLHKNCLFVGISVHLKNYTVHESAYAYEYKLMLKNAMKSDFFLKKKRISVSNVCDSFAKHFFVCYFNVL